MCDGLTLKTNILAQLLVDSPIIQVLLLIILKVVTKVLAWSLSGGISSCKLDCLDSGMI